ncbi:MAG: hypothetical protein IJ125_01285 [Atopobiaceae bacterium]|nr:hypothetical protein [Atopobiaceae bacterium]
MPTKTYQIAVHGVYDGSRAAAAIMHRRRASHIGYDYQQRIERAVITMHYTGPVIRPPYEAGSVMLEVTVGCTHDSCTFCTYYR